MVSLGDFVTQFYQPYFFYSLFFLLLSFICVEIFLKFSSSLNVKTRSILHLMPLFLPVFSLIFFQPKTKYFSAAAAATPTFGYGQHFSRHCFGRRQNSVLECCFNHWLVMYWRGGCGRCVFYGDFCFWAKNSDNPFHVVMMGQEEYVLVQEKVKAIAQKMSISSPKVGLIDDLRPNAFTLGYGRGTVLVFSLGILKILDTEELEAVVSHELSHIKARDYFFKSISCSLNLLSFFNPLSYFASSYAEQEREFLADEKGATLLRKPELMASVLTKIEGVLQGYPRERFSNRLSASLFLVSPLARRPEILAAHPQVLHRVNKINVATSKQSIKSHRRVATALLMTILISTAILAGYAAVNAQTSFLQTNPIFLSHGQIINTQFTNQSVIVTGPNFSTPNLPNLQSIEILVNSNDSAIPIIQQGLFP